MPPGGTTTWTWSRAKLRGFRAAPVRDVLDAGAVVELEVLLDLALALPLGRLVDRELDLAAPVRHHLRHQRRVLRLNLIVAEVDDVGHAEDALVKLHPGVHASEL